MEERKRKRSIYISHAQKEKLIELLNQNPLLKAGKRTDSTYSNLDAQRAWQAIAREINSIPGSKKHWKQWKKTWQDMKTKFTNRKYVSANGAELLNKLSLSGDEKSSLMDKSYSEEITNTDFAAVMPLDENEDDFHDENMSGASISPPPSPKETKIFTSLSNESQHCAQIASKNKKRQSQQTSCCSMNCDMVVANEKKKIKLKEDFINFKKDYLRQKLRMLREQTEALKSIAREIGNK